MGNPRSPRRGGRSARLVVGGVSVRTLTVTVVLGMGASFGLVAGAMTLLKSQSASSPHTFADPHVALSAGAAPLADAHGDTPGPASGPASPAAAPPAAAVPPSATGGLSRAQAITLVQGRYRARVVRTSLSQDREGHRLYVFRLLSGSGKVWTVRIDAQTGAEVP